MNERRFEFGNGETDAHAGEQNVDRKGPLDEKQAKVIKFYVENYGDGRRAPSARKIMEGTGIKSRRVLQSVLESLVEINRLSYKNGKYFLAVKNEKKEIEKKKRESSRERIRYLEAENGKLAWRCNELHEEVKRAFQRGKAEERSGFEKRHREIVDEKREAERRIGNIKEQNAGLRNELMHYRDMRETLTTIVGSIERAMNMLYGLSRNELLIAPDGTIEKSVMPSVEDCKAEMRIIASCLGCILASIKRAEELKARADKVIRIEKRARYGYDGDVEWDGE